MLEKLQFFSVVLRLEEFLQDHKILFYIKQFFVYFPATIFHKSDSVGDTVYFAALKHTEIIGAEGVIRTPVNGICKPLGDLRTVFVCFL